MITLTDVRKTYGSEVTIGPLDLEIPAGGVTALVGPNGVGKSTTLRCIVGSESPDAGEVRLGEALLDTRVPQTRRALCTVLGDLGVLPELTVAEHLDVLARGHGVADPRDVVAGALDEARIEHVADQLPGTLSSGQAQRFALASAMVRPWARLLADEPEQRLDDTGRAWLGDWLAAHAAAGRAVLVACHDPEVISRSGARVVTVEGDA